MIGTRALVRAEGSRAGTSLARFFAFAAATLAACVEPPAAPVSSNSTGSSAPTTTSGSASVERAQEPLTFRAEPATVVGDRCAHEAEGRLNHEAVRNGEKTAHAERFELRQSNEVLAIHGDKVVERVRFDHVLAVVDGTPKEKPAVFGISWKVDPRVDDLAASVGDESGKAAPRDVRMWVGLQWRIAKRKNYGGLLAGKQLLPGESVPELVDAFGDSGDKPSVVRSAKVTFVGRDGADARFDFDIEKDVTLEFGTAPIRFNGTALLSVPGGRLVYSEITVHTTMAYGDCTSSSPTSCQRKTVTNFQIDKFDCTRVESSSTDAER